MSESLDWYRILVFLKIHKLPLIPLRSKVAFDANLYAYHVILLSFHVNPKSFRKIKSVIEQSNLRNPLGILELSL